MAYLFENETNKKALAFISYLEKEGFQATIPEDANRDYLIKIEISYQGNPIGKFLIYFKPSKNIFSIGIKGIKPEYRDMVSAVWDKMNIDKKIVPYKDKGIEIDVDGSFRNGKTSYAAIIRKDGKVIKNISGLMEENEVKDSRQVAGELRAAMEAIKWCKENNISEADIYYDMVGTENWATGKWKAKKEITKAFVEFIKKSDVKINWIKVASHTGVKWNEEVDRLATRESIIY